MTVQKKEAFEKQQASLHAEIDRIKKRSKVLAKGLRDARQALTDARIDLQGAVDLAHRMLSKHYTAFPYLKEKKGDIFLLGRELLRKHGRLEEVGL